MAQEGGQHMTEDNALFPRPREACRHHKIFLAQAQKATTHHARQPRPADKGEHDRHPKVEPRDGPICRQRRGQPHH